MVFGKCCMVKCIGPLRTFRSFVYQRRLIKRTKSMKRSMSTLPLTHDQHYEGHHALQTHQKARDTPLHSASCTPSKPRRLRSHFDGSRRLPKGCH